MQQRDKERLLRLGVSRRLGIRLAAAITLFLLIAPPLPAAAAPCAGASLSLTPANQTLIAPGTASLTATLTCAVGTVAGQTIRYTVLGANPASNAVTTNLSGVATISYVGSNAGTDMISTFADLNNNGVRGFGEPSAIAGVLWIAGPASLALAPGSQTLAVGTTATVTATLEDASSNTVPNVTVRFSVSGANPGAASGTTNADGQTSFSYTGSNTGGDTVTAYADFNGNGSREAGEPQATATITWTAAAALTLTPASQTLAAGSSATITATLTNPAGSISGVTVRFTVTGANSTSGTATTNTGGVASFSYTGSNGGADTISALADLNGNGTQETGEPTATATVNWRALTLAPASQTVNVGSSASLTATLINPGGSASGVTIRYTVTGANPTSGTAMTNASGVATISYTGGHTGTDTVTAYADLNGNGTKNANEPSATATVTWSTGAALTLAPSNQNVQVGSSATVTATLTNPAGSVSGVTVRFTVTGVNPTSGTGTTNANGVATFTYTGTNTGADTVSAFADLNGNGSQDSGEPSASATVNWTGVPPFAPAQPAAPKAGCTYFSIVQHNLCAGFQAYWNAFGGLATYGYPLTEEFVENGMTVQYFERARFEWHPGVAPARYDVLLGLLGDEVTAGRQSEAPFQRASANPNPNCVYFVQTGHNLCYGFQAYWNAFGGLPIFGYPISEEFKEQNPDTGQVYTVQYFERARFEWHPGEFPQRFDVLLGRLGAQVLAARYGVR